MRLIQFIELFLVLIFLSTVGNVTANIEWSNKLEEGNDYHWKAEKKEIPWEEYHHGVGGINIPGGDNKINLLYYPEPDFNFFKGDRLNISITVEYDMAIWIEDPDFYNTTDWWLLILPIKINETNFFELLFDEINLLESFTQAKYISHKIEENHAEIQFKYNESLDIFYSWDTNTGFLTRKEVINAKGDQIVVVQGKGSGEQIENFQFFIPITSVLIILVLKNKLKNTP